MEYVLAGLIIATAVLLVLELRQYERIKAWAKENSKSSELLNTITLGSISEFQTRLSSLESTTGDVITDLALTENILHVLILAAKLNPETVAKMGNFQSPGKSEK